VLLGTKTFSISIVSLITNIYAGFFNLPYQREITPGA